MGKALEVPILDESVERVATNIAQYLIVKVSGTTVVIAGAGETEAPMGVVQNAPTTTKEVPSVRTIGVSKCKAGAAVSVGDKITSDSAGKGITSAPSAGVNSGIVGIARTAAGAVDEVFSLKLQQSVFQGA